MYAIAESTVCKWLASLRSWNIDLEDREHSDRPAVVQMMMTISKCGLRIIQIQRNESSQRCSTYLIRLLVVKPLKILHPNTCEPNRTSTVVQSEFHMSLIMVFANHCQSSIEGQIGYITTLIFMDVFMTVSFFILLKCKISRLFTGSNDFDSIKEHNAYGLYWLILLCPVFFDYRSVRDRERE